MNSKFYVSLDAARLLKEKGYNEKCTFAYTDISNGSDINGRIVFNSNDYPVGIYPCPTKAEVIDWLESKGIYISVYYRKLTGKFFCEIHYNKMLYKDKESDLTEDYKTRCEAKDAVLIKALKVL